MNLRQLISTSKEASGDLIDLDVNAEWDKFQKKIGHTVEKKKTNPTLRRIIPYAAAACILGISILFYFLLSNNKNTPLSDTEHDPIGLANHQQLPDGSDLDLSPNAEFELINFNKSSLRQVLFKNGVGKFSVVKDSLVPFVVLVDHLAVKVLGTVFTINKSDSAIMVYTSEGLVSVSSPGYNKEEIILIHKGEYFTFYNLDQGPGMKVKETNTNFFATVDSLSQKKFIVESTPGEKIESGIHTYYLEHIIKFLQRKYQGKFKLARRTKFDKKAKINVDLDAEFNVLVRSICDQTNLKTRPGKCPDCIILYIEKKK